MIISINLPTIYKINIIFIINVLPIFCYHNKNNHIHGNYGWEMYSNKFFKDLSIYITLKYYNTIKCDHSAVNNFF